MHYGLTDEQKIMLESFIPERFIHQKPTFRKNDPGLNYIPGPYVNQILDDVFGNGAWSFSIQKSWLQASEPYTDKNNKNNGGTPVVYNQAPFASVLGRLSYLLYPQKDYPEEDISDYSPKEFYKEAFGSHVLMGKSDVQESAFKAAGTDALKKCASLLGIARELYTKRDINEFRDFNTWIKNVTNEWNYETTELYGDYINKINLLESKLVSMMKPEEYTAFKQELYKRIGLPENTKDYNPTPKTVILYADTFQSLMDELEKVNTDAS